MIYHSIADELTAEGRLRLDALLGDPDAIRQRNEHRQQVLAQFAGRP